MVSRRLKNKVWIMAEKAKGLNPYTYRKDPYGKIIRYDNHGKSSPMGWDVDHIIPKSKGGTDRLLNLQALQTHTNRSKGNSFVKKNRHRAFLRDKT